MPIYTITEDQDIIEKKDVVVGRHPVCMFMCSDGEKFHGQYQAERHEKWLDIKSRINKIPGQELTEDEIPAICKTGDNIEYARLFYIRDDSDCKAIRDYFSNTLWFTPENYIGQWVFIVEYDNGSDSYPKYTGHFSEKELEKSLIENQQKTDKIFASMKM